MPTAETHVADETEAERINRWRLQELERAGYARKDAALLAASKEVDLHLASELLSRGCPPELAVRILL